MGPPHGGSRAGRRIRVFEDITPESIKAAILAEAGESLETREGSFLDSMAGPAALEIWKVYQAMNAVVSIAFVDESSGGSSEKILHSWMTRCGNERTPSFMPSSREEFHLSASIVNE